MSLYTIGDLHLPFGDKNKPMHIFPGWENYVTRIESNWNKIIKSDDTVVIIGDISWALKIQDALSDFKYINNCLNGKKIIIKGNHDLWWTSLTKMNQFFLENNLDKIKILHNNSYLEEGISICGTRGWINTDEFCTNTNPSDIKIIKREAIRLENSIKNGIEKGGEPFVFIHYPPVYSNNENQLILDLLETYNIKHCYYAHLHGRNIKKAFIESRNKTKYYLCSADGVNFCPLKIK